MADPVVIPAASVPPGGWTRRGRCWTVGDDLVLDSHVMPFKFAIDRVTDPEVLTPHLFGAVDPSLAGRLQPGDVIVAGRNFGRGHVHVQGFIAMRAIGVGLVARSMPYEAYRAAISQGLLCLTPCDDVQERVHDGDEIEVNFETGCVRNHSRGSVHQYPPLDPLLRAICAEGGLMGYVRRQLAGAR